MKRILKFAACAALAGALAGCAFGCGKATGSVELVEVSAKDIGRVSGIDYYAVPEPAATAMCKNLTNAGVNYSIVGDVQKLYGENGYPQAVIVAKNSLLEGDGKFVKAFIDGFKDTGEWLAAQTDFTAVVNAVNANGGKSLDADKITPAVVANCNISYRKASGEKQAIKDYMQSVKDIAPAMYAECSDSFFADADSIDATTVSESVTTVSVYMPDGAPALSMAKMMCAGGELGKSVEYKVVDAELINSTVTANDEKDNADICVMPVNAAVKLLGSGARYKLLGTVTHGNIFIISSEGEELKPNKLASQLNGKKLGVVSLSKVPGLTLKMVLGKHGITY